MSIISNYGYIYITTNLITHMVYIGKRTLNKFDPTYLGSGLRLWNAINKYGIKYFKVELICWEKSRFKLNKSEQFYISYYRILYARENVYNITDGGDGGDALGKDSRNFGKIKSSEHRKRLASTHLGKKESLETIRKISEALVGNTHVRGKHWHWSASVRSIIKNRSRDSYGRFVKTQKER